MLSTRSVSTSQGQLPVEVASPRGALIARLVRNLTWKGALLGALVGFFFSSWQHSSGQRPERGKAALSMLGRDTLKGAVAGGAAGLAGSMSYGLLGGPGGAVAATGIAALVGTASHFAIPALSGVPQGLVPEDEPRWSLESVMYVPVFVDKDIKEEAPPPAPPYHGPWNDSVVFLGMNAGPTSRASTRMKSRANVSVVVGSSRQDTIRVGGKLYDLRNKAGIQSFARSLGFNAEKTARIVRAFTICEKDARDELAGLALIWARGEKGQNIPSRLVLAGHSNGDGVWGDDNGSLRLGPLLHLSRALPKATAQIEDAFVTGCYSGGEVTMDQYLLLFPRAKTIWAYEAQAPGVDNGATLDQGGWERATRGRTAQVPSLKSASTGKNMAIWTFKSGGGGVYHANKPALTVNELRGKVQWMEEHFLRPAMRGEEFTYDQGFLIPIRITDPHTGLIRQYYSWLVRLSQAKALPEDERASWVAKKHQTIRLLYYSATVAPRFEANHGARVRRSFSKLGLEAPNFARASRRQALAAVSSYMKKLNSQKNPSAELEQVGSLLQRGVRDLDPAIIPDGWV